MSIMIHKSKSIEITEMGLEGFLLMKDSSILVKLIIEKKGTKHFVLNAQSVNKLNILKSGLLIYIYNKTG